VTSTTSDPRWAIELLRSMSSRGRQVAFTDGVHERTHAESHARALALAHDLGARGIGPGDRVALVVESTADAVEGYLAVNLVGATAVQVNDRLAVAEIDEILGTVSPRALLHTEAHGERLADLVAGAGLDVVALGGPLDVVSGASVPRIDVDPGAPSIIGFTSGTTGRPKGVVHTHANLGRIVRYMPIHNHLAWGSRLAMTGTLAFAAGIWGVVLPHLYLGGTISWMAGLPADEWVDRMVRERSTFTYCPTPLFGAFTAAVTERPEVLESLSSVLHSGSAATREATAALVDVIGGRFTETYGMTETGSPVTTTGPDDWAPWSGADDALASAGRVIALARVAVLGDDGAELPAGAEGELVVESPFLFDGYWENPVETAAALRDGQLHTGDRGRVDEAGFLYVMGRSKDMIVSGGMSVYPAEVERVLAQADGVADVAVFGVSHDKWGETVVAAVVARPGETVDVDGVLAFARERLAGYKKPTVIHVVDELPRNTNLKVRKDVLRDRFDQKQP
jgi:fatty-acyl-CoA synthase